MNALERKITPLFLVKFTLPTIVMMVFNSFYTMVDGGFVSNFVGTDALSAVNIVYPVISLVLAVGIMLATGGCAVVAKQMGEGKEREARQSFSMLSAVGAAFGMAIALTGVVFTEQIVVALGANESIYAYCYDYAFYTSLFSPFAILQILFQYFFVAAGQPNLGLVSTVLGGIANIVLDYVFIVPLDMGIKGAAIATGIGFAIPAFLGLFYFAGRINPSLHFVRPVLHVKTLLQACANGSSEMVSNLSVAVTTFLFNVMMMRYIGADGVAAITIVLYAQFLFTAVFLGYTSGVAPLISFNYGARNTRRLKKIYRMSLLFTAACSAVAAVLSVALAGTVVRLFAKPDTGVYELAIHGMYLFATGFLFMGLNIFASGLFTALSNGRVSAIFSFLRTFVFIVAAVLILPALLGVDGIWLSIPAAEGLALIISAGCMIRFKKVYDY